MAQIEEYADYIGLSDLLLKHPIPPLQPGDVWAGISPPRPAQMVTMPQSQYDELKYHYEQLQQLKYQQAAMQTPSWFIPITPSWFTPATPPEPPKTQPAIKTVSVTTVITHTGRKFRPE